MAPKIHTPTPDVTDVIAGVAFVQGVGQTDDEPALAYFARHGYAVTDDVDERAGVDVPDGDPVVAWTKAQLVAYAAREGVELGDAKNKDDVLAVIVAAKKPADGVPPQS